MSGSCVSALIVRLHQGEIHRSDAHLGGKLWLDWGGMIVVIWRVNNLRLSCKEAVGH